MSTTPNTVDSLTSSVLSTTRFALAVTPSDGGEPVWCNARFAALAERLGVAPCELADAPQVAGWRRTTTPMPSVEGGASLRLVELAPAEPAGRSAAAPSIDPVTNVLSRSVLVPTLNQWFDKRDERPFALVFLDLDGFKRVNDEHGHIAGDQCLRGVGKRLQQAVRYEDVVGRYGGDEFLILLAGVRDAETYAPIERRLRAEVETSYTDAADSPPIGVSLGVAYSDAGYTDADDLITAADRAMYADKRLAGSRS